MNNYHNAFSEVSTILQHLEFKDLKKIPKDIIRIIEENKNLEYQYIINKEKELKEQKMLPETKAILANLYREFIATDEKKEIIRDKEKNEILNLEKEKTEKFSSEVMFKNKEINKNILIVNEKETLLKRIKNRIIDFFQYIKEYIER